MTTQLTISRREAAKMLGIHPDTLSAITERDGIPVVVVGKSYLYDPADLKRWRDRNKRCLSTSDREAKTGITTSSAKVVSFREAQAQAQSAKPKR